MLWTASLQSPVEIPKKPARNAAAAEELRHPVWVGEAGKTRFLLPCPLERLPAEVIAQIKDGYS